MNKQLTLKLLNEAHEIQIVYHRPKDPVIKISCSKDIVNAIIPVLEDKIEYKEFFYVIFLNRINNILCYSKISEGGIAGTVVDLRIIFGQGVKINASSIILIHNHPSGNILPSDADRKLTKKTVDAGKILDIPVLDHIIITEDPNSYFSFADEGIL